MYGGEQEDESEPRSRPVAGKRAQVAGSESHQVRQQICQLKYKCAFSLCILLVLLTETVVRRLEEGVQKQEGGVLPFVVNNLNRSYWDSEWKSNG